MNFGELSRAFSQYDSKKDLEIWISYPPSITALYDFLRGKDAEVELSNEETMRLKSILSDIKTAFPDEASLENQLAFKCNSFLFIDEHHSFFELKQLVLATQFNATIADLDAYKLKLGFSDLHTTLTPAADASASAPPTGVHAVLSQLLAQQAPRDTGPNPLATLFAPSDMRFDLGCEVLNLYKGLSPLQRTRVQQAAMRFSKTHRTVVDTWKIIPKLKYFESHILPLVPMLKEEQATEFFVNFIAMLPISGLDPSVIIDGTALLLLAAAPTHEAKLALAQTITPNNHDIALFCRWLCVVPSYSGYYTLALVLDNTLLHDGRHYFNEPEVVVTLLEGLASESASFKDVAQEYLAYNRMLAGDHAGLLRDSHGGSQSAIAMLHAIADLAAMQEAAHAPAP